MYLVFRYNLFFVGLGLGYNYCLVILVVNINVVCVLFVRFLDSFILYEVYFVSRCIYVRIKKKIVLIMRLYKLL